MKNKIFLIILLLSFVATQDEVAAIKFDGYSSTEFYIQTDSMFSHVRAYQNLYSDITFKQAKRVTFHSNIRYVTDFKDKLSSDPQLFIRSAYFDLKNKSNKFNLSIGRQFVYSGSGSALIDGGQITLSDVSDFKISFFGGAEVDRLDPETIQKFKDFAVLGSRISRNVTNQFRIGLNWFFKNDQSQTAQHKIGYDIDYHKSQFNLFNRINMNVLHRRLAEIRTRVAYTISDWRLRAEYLYREPSVSYNSFFSLVKFYNVKRLMVSGTRKISNFFSISSSYYLGLFEQNNSNVFSIGVRIKQLNLNYNHKSGYGGDSNGLNGSYYFVLPKQLTALIRFNISSYQIQEQEIENHNNHALSLSLKKSFLKNWQVSTEWQYLKNVVNSSDNRFLLRVSKSFSVGKVGL